MNQMMIVPINSGFRPKVNQHIADEWDGPIIITKGISHNTSGADGFISVADGILTGCILYCVQDYQCEILVLQSLSENHGIGSGLIKAVMDVAKSNNCRRIWLITKKTIFMQYDISKKLG